MKIKTRYEETIQGNVHASHVQRHELLMNVFLAAYPSTAAAATHRVFFGGDLRNTLSHGACQGHTERLKKLPNTARGVCTGDHANMLAAVETISLCSELCMVQDSF